jgi:hypothetical protein
MDNVTVHIDELVLDGPVDEPAHTAVLSRQ